MTIASSSYPFLNVMWSIFIFFGWVLFIWLLITVYSDLFRRRDIGGWVKAGWILFTVFLPYIGVFCYLILEGRAMGRRNQQREDELRAQTDEYVRSVAGGSSSADQIAQAKQLLDTGAITPDEYSRIKQKALAG